MANIIRVNRANDTIELPLLTASRLLAITAGNVLDDTDIISWIAGTANQIIVTDDADGTITLSGPQDIHTSASPTFAALSLGTGELTVGSINRTSGTLTLEIGEIPQLSITSTALTLAGNLGIGTTVPLTKFVVSKDEAEGFEIDIITDLVYVTAFDRTAGVFENMFFRANTFQWGIGATAKMSMASSGAVDVVGSLTGGTLHADNGANFSGAVTNITVVDGIVTAVS